MCLQPLSPVAQGSNTLITDRPITIPAGDHGTLRGIEIVASDGTVRARRFCQVPYAQAPAGELRWRKPVPLPNDHDWSGVEGDKFGYIAPQPTYVMKNDAGDEFPSGVPGAVANEDSLTFNVWTPPGEPPAGGWPLFVWIHGGWLQIGASGMTDRTDPSWGLGDGALKAVVVMPAYRLGLFGFLASEEIRAENDDGTAGNFGFWDQRLALEVIKANAAIFGANGDNLTLGGLSAGAYSAQMQVAYDLRQPQPIVKRLMLWSNTLPAQPKSLAESQPGFDGLCEKFGVTGSGEEKMKKLRAIPMQDLVDAVLQLKIHTFRAVTDDAFIPSDLYASFHDGRLAAALKKHNIPVLLGEVAEEELLYGVTNPPSSRADLRTQLDNYYGPAVVQRLLDYYDPQLPPDQGELERGSEEWKALRAKFGEITANGQVYVPERALVRSLIAGGVDPNNILRYRVAWKPDAYAKISLFGEHVTHADDYWCWWYGARFGWTEKDKKVNREWLAPLQVFLEGRHEEAAKEWYQGQDADGRKLREIRDGKIGVAQDDRWDECMRIADAIAGK